MSFYHNHFHLLFLFILSKTFYMFEVDIYVLAINYELDYVDTFIFKNVSIISHVTIYMHIMRLYMYIYTYRLTQTHMQSIWNNKSICASQC